MDEKIVTDLADQRNLNPTSAMTKQRHFTFMAGSQKLATFKSAKCKSSR